MLAVTTTTMHVIATRYRSMDFWVLAVLAVFKRNFLKEPRGPRLNALQPLLGPKSQKTSTGTHVDLALHPFTYFTCGEAIAEVGHLELIFTSCPYSSFLRKKSWSRAKTNSKGVPRPT